MLNEIGKVENIPEFIEGVKNRYDSFGLFKLDVSLQIYYFREKFSLIH